MPVYKRTLNITDIDWSRVFAVHEAYFETRIDGAIDQREWDQHSEEICRRLGACQVYGNGYGIFGQMKYRDQILMDLGITLGFEEVES